MTIIELLVKHEGLKLKPYICTAGKLTIGIGRNLTDVGISEIEAYMLLDSDIRSATSEASRIFPNFWILSDNRKNVLIDMLVNLGLGRFMGFKNFISAVKEEKWGAARYEMLDSLWATQVPSRAQEDATLILAG